MHMVMVDGDGDGDGDGDYGGDGIVPRISQVAFYLDKSTMLMMTTTMRKMRIKPVVGWTAPDAKSKLHVPAEKAESLQIKLKPPEV